MMVVVSHSKLLRFTSINNKAMNFFTVFKTFTIHCCLLFKYPSREILNALKESLLFTEAFLVLMSPLKNVNTKILRR